MLPNRPFNSWDGLKIIALLLMFVDHAGAYFFFDQYWLRAMGRGAAPLFLFLAGYGASYRFNKEIFALACLMTLSNILQGFYFNPLNILFTILLCRAVFAWLEKRGRVIEKLWEWFVVLAIFALLSNFIMEYGTLGLMFAVYGYMKRRPLLYSPKTQQCFLIGTFVVYGAMFTFLFDFSMIDVLVAALTLLVDYHLISRFDIRPVAMKNTPPWLVGVLSFCSHYSGYIYAFHLIIISWMTHLPI